MAKAPTPYMAFLLPVPGSKEPFRVADVNGWFQTIDTKFQSSDGVQAGLDGRLDAIEPFLLPGFAEPTAKHGLIPAGTAAERDAYWGTPGAGQARIDLANRYARWHNTEKGWVEQYRCASDEVGTGKLVGTPQAKTARWAPVVTDGRVPILLGTASGGTPSNVKKHGSEIEIVSPGTNPVWFDGVFTADFDAYDVEFDLDAAAALTDMAMQFRQGGVIYAGAAYDHERYGVVGTSVTAVGATNATQFAAIAAVNQTVGTLIRLRITNPMQAKNKRIEFFGGTGGAILAGTAIVKNTGLMDGLQFGNGGALTSGLIRVFGVSPALT